MNTYEKMQKACDDAIDEVDRKLCDAFMTEEVVACTCPYVCQKHRDKSREARKDPPEPIEDGGAR